MNESSAAMQQAVSASTDGAESWDPEHLGGERVVEGLHYGWLMRDHLARYEFASKYCKGKRILDVATGTGYGANILRRNGAANVVAVDRNQDVLDYAAKRYGTDGLRWVKADAYSLPFEAEFDVVASFETIEHLKEPERFAQECKRLVKPGGTFLVSTPLSVGGPVMSDFHELEFSREDFEALLARNFSSFELFGQRRELSMMIKPFGDFPTRYWDSNIKQGKGSHRIFTMIDRLNKAPNLVAARLIGLGDSFRSQIKPIDERMRQSKLLQPHYFIMIAICRVD